MPRGRRRSSASDLVVFSSGDPTQLVNWLCEKYGLQAVLQAVSEFRPSQGQGASQGARKKRGRPAGKKGGKKGGKAGGKRRGRPRKDQSEQG